MFSLDGGLDLVIMPVGASGWRSRLTACCGTSDFGALAVDPTMRSEAPVSIADVLKVARGEPAGTSAAVPRAANFSLACEADRLAVPSTKVRRSISIDGNACPGSVVILEVGPNHAPTFLRRKQPFPVERLGRN